MRAWPNAALPVMVHELGLVGRHVDMHRAFALAALAGEAEIERIMHGLGAPALRHLVADQHLPEHARAATGGVFLAPCRHIAWAHQPFIMLAALADADATRGGLGDVIALLVKAEARRCLPAGRRAGCADVLDRTLGVDDLAGVQLPFRIPQRFVFDEGLNQLLSEHARQQRAPRLAITMLTRKRAAMRDHEIGGAVEKAAEFFATCLPCQPEIDAAMHQPIAE